MYLRLTPFLPKIKLQYKPGTASKVADASAEHHFLSNGSDTHVQTKVLQMSQQELEPFHDQPVLGQA